MAQHPSDNGDDDYDDADPIKYLKRLRREGPFHKVHPLPSGSFRITPFDGDHHRKQFNKIVEDAVKCARASNGRFGVKPAKSDRDSYGWIAAVIYETG
jgi:hypothetical protein